MLSWQLRVGAGLYLSPGQDGSGLGAVIERYAEFVVLKGNGEYGTFEGGVETVAATYGFAGALVGGEWGWSSWVVGSAV